MFRYSRGAALCASLCASLSASLGLGAALLAGPAEAAPSSRAASAAARSARAAGEYVIGAEDVLEVRVRNHDALNRLVTVRPDGKITFPRAGEMVATGRTAAEVGRELRTRLERTLNNVTVEVEIKQARPRLVRVIGAAKAPNAYKMSEGWRVMDLVAAAGGLSAKPERVSARLVRAGSVRPFSIAQAIAQPLSAANLKLEPDDVLVLDESSLPNQVTVTGSVTKPGAYELQDGLTVTSLLGQVGGPAATAALKQAHVLRAGVPIPLDLTGLGTPGGVPATTAAFRFQIGDVLVLPENQVRFGVMGQVNSPAYYRLPERAEEATLLKALAAAGGPTAGADLKAATITRMKGGASEVTTVNLDAMLKGAAPDNVTLKADEVLFVPKRSAQVHVIGPVSKPGAYELQENMSLMSLISEAGIPSQNAGLSRAYVQRGGEQLPVDLRAVLVEGKVDEALRSFRLRDGDVLVIPDAATPRIHVIGQVPRPGAYSLDDKLTVASLVAQIGNPTASAALSRAYVLRGDKQIALDLHRFLVVGEATGAAASFRFEPGDVLVVPENKTRYAVMGQVGRPGYLPFPETRSEATVLKALAEAGGPAANDANLAGAGIIRTVQGKAMVIPVNVADILQKGDLRGNVLLQPEDILYIPPKKRGFKWTDVLAPLSALSMLGIG